MPANARKAQCHRGHIKVNAVPGLNSPVIDRSVASAVQLQPHVPRGPRREGPLALDEVDSR